MLWSLIKILVFVAIVAALAIGAAALMEVEGGVRVTVAGTEYTLGPLQSVIGLLVLIVAVWLLLKLLSLGVAFLRFLNGDETALSRRRTPGRRPPIFLIVSSRRSSRLVGVSRILPGHGYTSPTRRTCWPSPARMGASSGRSSRQTRLCALRA